MNKSDIPVERGNREGQPVSVHFWTTEDGCTMLRLTSRTVYQSGRPRKTGLMMDITGVPPEHLGTLLGSATLSLLSWVCSDKPLVGDMGPINAAYGLSVYPRVYDIEETGYSPETQAEWVS